MFDTNAIFTKEFDTLINQTAKKLIDQHSDHGDLDIHWVIPEVVRGEREYQMRNEYRGIASHLTRAERLFGQDWGITQVVVEQRISARIADELAGLRVAVVPCDITRVDWADVMRRSCFREPPFERGQTEKGFRDAVVCETFIQLARTLAGRDTAVLVSNDRLIKEYIDGCGLEGHRARVVEDINALHDEIQLRVANVDENTQVFIEQRAQQLFLPWDRTDDPTCLWNREKLYERIMAEHGVRLKQVPAGTEYVFVSHGLSNARLVSKEGARVNFENVYTVQSAFRIWIPTPTTPQAAPNATLTSLAHVTPQDLPTEHLLGLSTEMAAANFNVTQGSPSRGLIGLVQGATAGEWKQFLKQTSETIQIRWSATFSRHRTLTRPSIHGLELVP